MITADFGFGVWAANPPHIEPTQNEPTWRERYFEEIAGPNWGEGDPWKTKCLTFERLLNAYDLPQDMSLIACFLMRTKGYDWDDRGVILQFKHPYRSELLVDGIRYSVYDHCIYERPL